MSIPTRLIIQRWQSTSRRRRDPSSRRSRLSGKLHIDTLREDLPSCSGSRLGHEVRPTPCALALVCGEGAHLVEKWWSPQAMTKSKSGRKLRTVKLIMLSLSLRGLHNPGLLIALQRDFCRFRTGKDGWQEPRRIGANRQLSAGEGLRRYPWRARDMRPCRKAFLGRSWCCGRMCDGIEPVSGCGSRNTRACGSWSGLGARREMQYRMVVDRQGPGHACRRRCSCPTSSNNARMPLQHSNLRHLTQVTKKEPKLMINQFSFSPPGYPVMLSNPQFLP